MDKQTNAMGTLYLKFFCGCVTKAVPKKDYFFYTDLITCGKHRPMIGEADSPSYNSALGGTYEAISKLEATILVLDNGNK